MRQLALYRFSKRCLLIWEGVYRRYACFTEKGATRLYWLVDGKEVTTSLLCEGDVVFSMNELYHGKPSEGLVETLEDVPLYAIPTRTLIELRETNIELANQGRITRQNRYREFHRKHKKRSTLSARERYTKLKERLPDVCNRVNLDYIAAYSGITLPTLNEIRAEE